MSPWENEMSQRQPFYKPPYSRTVQTGGLLPLTAWQYSRHTAYPGGVWSKSLPNITGLTKFSTGTVTPAYSWLVKQGAIVNTPYYTSIDNRRGIKNVAVSFDTKDAVTSPHQGWDFIGPLNVMLGDLNPYQDLVNPTSLEYLATLDAWSKVESAQAQTLTSLVELPKTVDMIRNAATRLYNDMRALRKGKLPPSLSGTLSAHGRKFRKPRPGKPYASYWLEYRYGWLPTIMDIVGHLKALNKDPSRILFKARGSKSLSDKRETAINGVWFTNPVNGTSISDFGGFNLRELMTDECNVRCYVLYSVDPSWTKPNALGVTNPALTVWEVIPWSFVVDWFISVGDWIQAVNPKVGVNVRATGLSVTRRKMVNRTVTGYVEGYYWNGGASLVGQTYGTEQYSFQRKTELPSLWYPPIDVNLNVKRSVDAIALLSQLRKG